MSATKIVRFTAATGEYAIVAERVLQIRSASDIVAMPSPSPQVVGLISFDARALSVVSAFGAGGDHVLIVDTDSGPFGILAEQVTAVVDIDPGSIGGRPGGQAGGFVSGVITQAGKMTMLVDPEAVARLLAS
jgi:chemotaxis signal transduction protein